jgi:tetrahydromethanopterin S-methyltransferase subunit F
MEQMEIKSELIQGLLLAAVMVAVLCLMYFL